MTDAPISSRRSSRAAVALSVCLGALAGAGAFTTDFAEATSYFSNDPAACVNCHIMREQYDAWMKGAHHGQTCNDCHLPREFFGKYVTKAENGYRHSKGFTFQDFHEPIRITQGGIEVVQQNCVRCHETLVGDIGSARAHGADAAETGSGCVHCHAGVGHGPMR